jgi:hypothetical protein
VTPPGHSGLRLRPMPNAPARGERSGFDRCKGHCVPAQHALMKAHLGRPEPPPKPPRNEANRSTALRRIMPS